MADSGNGKTLKVKLPEEKKGAEKNLLIALALMGVVLFGTQFFMPQSKVTPTAQKQPEKPAGQSSPTPDGAAASQNAAAALTTTPAQPTSATAKSAAKSETYVIETDLYKIAFSNQGATVRSWILKKYLDTNRKPVDVADAAGTEVAGWPFAYIFRNQSPKPATDLNKVLFVASQPDPLTIEFEYSDGQTVAKKTFRLDPRQYRAEVKSEVIDGGRALGHLLAWRGGFGDRTAHNAHGTMQSVAFDIPANKLIAEGASVAKAGPHTISGNYSFAGIQDTYFAGVVLPASGESIDFQTWRDMFPVVQDGEAVEHVGVAWGSGGTMDFNLFVGPKDTQILRATNPKLEQLIDWGWFGIIAKPLFLFLHWMNDNYTSNWGWAIVVVTIIINALLLPLKFSSLRSMQKMQKIQPEVNALNEKFKGVSMKDPRKQQQNQELMELYKKHGINPLGGCVPLLLQMPFFFAFFKVLSAAIELRGAGWLWVADLAQPETGLFRVLPLAMLGTQFVVQKMTPSTTADPAQRRMMMMMPLVFVVMFWSAASGLVLYWLTGNVVSIVQQYFFNKLAPVNAPAQVQSTVSPKRKR